MNGDPDGAEAVPDLCMLPAEIHVREYGIDAGLAHYREALGDHLGRGGPLRLDFEGQTPVVRAGHFVGLLPFRCRREGCPQGGNHLVLLEPKGTLDDEGLGTLRFLELAFFTDPARATAISAGWLTRTRRPTRTRLVYLLAGHYARALRELCRSDFRLGYQAHEDELSGAVKGRLDVVRHLRNSGLGRAHRMPCRWEEFTADNLDNRILRRAMLELGRRADAIAPQAGAEVRRAFRPVAPWFAEVADVPIGEPELARSRQGRVSGFYREAMIWARLILRGIGRVEAGGVAGPVLLDSNRAFEKLTVFVAGRAARRIDPSWTVHDNAPLPRGILADEVAARRPDITVRGDGRCVAVGDAKYKQVIELISQDGRPGAGPDPIARQAIGAADWNQLYVAMRLASAPLGFFVVPYWKPGDARAARLLTDLRFDVAPLDVGEGVARVAILALNLMGPVHAIRREAEDELARWIRG